MMDIEFYKNEDQYKQLLFKLNKNLEKTKLGTKRGNSLLVSASTIYEMKVPIFWKSEPSRGMKCTRMSGAVLVAV
jgi:hypothetical protein